MILASHDEASKIYNALGRGVTRSKRRALQWLRKAADNGDAEACYRVASSMYGDQPYAREVGHVVEAAAIAVSAEVTEGHDVPRVVMTSVLHWLRKGGHSTFNKLNAFRSMAREGARYCHNETCVVVGQLKDFKVCPQCRSARYCAACQKQDWTTGGHKEKCGTFAGGH